jgi:diguanylate cyclase (GGDEF)-like protein/PAS domain S-box-containing protein
MLRAFVVCDRQSVIELLDETMVEINALVGIQLESSEVVEYNIPSTEEVDNYARLCIDHGADALVILDKDVKLIWQNRAFERLTGFSLYDFIGQSPRDMLVSEKTDQQDLERFAQYYAAQIPFTIELEFRRKTGEDFWLEINVTPVFNDDGKLKFFITSSRDTTSRRLLRASHELAIKVEKKRKEERRLLSQISEWLYSSKSLDELLRVIKKSLSVLMPETNGQLFVYSNSRDVLDLQTSWGRFNKVPHIDAEDCWSLRRGRAYSYGTKSIEFPCQHILNDGVETPYFCLPIIAHGQTNGLLHIRFKSQIFENSTPEEKSEFLKQRWQMALLCAEQISLALANVQLRQELTERSVRDPLTNLWNRRWLLEAAYKELKLAEKRRHPVSVLSLDVDHFKKFNDHHGHDAGDMILRALGNTMLEFFQTSASACRMGGEEFLILCPEISADAAVELAEKFRHRLTQINVNYGGTQLPKVTASIGVATYPKDAGQLDDLLMCADKAMYEAKEAGRDRVVSYQTEPAPRLRDAKKSG